MDNKPYDQKDRLPYETPTLKCHGDAKALTQVISDTMNMNDHINLANLKT
jgi:hypothetical protein